MNYDLQTARELVIQAGLELKRSGLIARTWGNISARISDSQFVITPSGRDYESLTPEDIVITNIADCSYEGHIRPSSEKYIHAAAYALRPNVSFVIHTHQNYASALSILGRVIPNIRTYSMHSGAILGPMVPCAAYGRNGSTQLRDNVTDVLLHYPKCNSLLLANHGAHCLGTSYDNAFEIAHVLEDVCKKDYFRLIAEQIVLPYDFEPDRLDGTTTILEDSELIKGTEMKAAILSEAPFTRMISSYRMELFPYLDDLAQIGGVSIRCVDAQSSDTVIREALADRNAVLLHGIGGVCIGTSLEDAEAACLVLEKNCRAALLAMSVQHLFPASPVSPEDAAFDRKAYIDSYSRLSTQNY